MKVLILAVVLLSGCAHVQCCTDSECEGVDPISEECSADYDVVADPLDLQECQ